MAEKDPNSEYAKRIDPTKEGLSKDQLKFIQQVEMEQWRKRTQRLKGRNVATGLAIAAITMGICILLHRASSCYTRLREDM